MHDPPSATMSPHSRVRIAFICTANACRSQMAEGLARAVAGADVHIQSAGSHPAGYIHPLAIDAMGEIGIDITRQRSKWIDDLDSPVDVVVTLCDNARDSCPTLRGRLATHHWPIADPVMYIANPLKAKSIASRIRGELTTRIDDLLRNLPVEPPRSSSIPRPSKFRRWAKKLMAMIVSFAIVLLAAEFGFRFFMPQPTGFYAFDDFNLPDGSLRPGASGILCGVPVTINSNAERGATFSQSKPPGTRRVCVIGDSIVFGLGVTDEDRYPTVTGRLLKLRHPGTPIEVIPFGQVAYRLSGYRTRLLPKALAHKPDVVVLGFVLNDFEPPPAGSAGPQVTTIAPTPESGFLAKAKSVTGQLRKHSHLVYWARKQAQVLLMTRLMDRDALVRAWELECMYPNTPEFKTMWEYTQRQLDEIRSHCAAAGAKLIIVVSPFDNQMNADRLAFYRQHLPDLPDSCLANVPQANLAAYCQSRSIPFVNVTPAFKANADKVFIRMLEGRLDLCHPTPEGHRLIAEALSRKLEELGTPRR